MSAVLVILNDIDPAAEADYETWYWQDHLRQRWELFDRRPARRYRRIAGDGRTYFTFYEAPGLDTFRSAAYQATLREPTQGTRRIMPSFRSMVRSLCVPILDSGWGTGGIVAALPLEPDDTTARQLRDALAPRFERLQAQPGITRLRLWQSDVEATNTPNPESRLRSGTDASISWMIVVEGALEERVADAARALVSDPLVARASPPASPPSYRLLAALP